MTALVTGSDSGIGRATAVALARAGHDVGITWHADEAGAQETAREVSEHGRRAVVHRLDVRRPSEARETVEAIVAELGGLDVLVNNAGVGHMTPFLEVELAEWQNVLDISLTGAFVVAQTAARAMVERGRGGRIVNVTSVHEHVPLRGSSAYTSAKHGLGGLTKIMALELAENGITVNAVAPGEIATAMTGNADADVSAIERPAIPIGRPGDAREVAAAIAWLCAPEASYATGASFVIDGGMLLMAAVANQQQTSSPSRLERAKARVTGSRRPAT